MNMRRRDAPYGAREVVTISVLAPALYWRLSTRSEFGSRCMPESLYFGVSIMGRVAFQGASPRLLEPPQGLSEGHCPSNVNVNPSLLQVYVQDGAPFGQPPGSPLVAMHSSSGSPFPLAAHIYGGPGDGVGPTIVG